MEIFTIYGQQYDSNVYVITGKKPTIIDTGTGLYAKDLLNMIEKHIDIKKIDQIILTHEHYDHVGGTLDIEKASGKKLVVGAHIEAVEKLKSGKSEFASLIGGSMPKIEVNMMLKGGEHILVGDEVFDIISTPGHSCGGLCLYGKKSKSLFSGDIVFADGGFGRYDFTGGDLKKLIKSIEQLCTIDILDLYPGHGEIVQHDGSAHVKQSWNMIRTMR
jgi:hydroxyacylglutathione hydrolase